jgi:hypothetical protein
LTTSSLRAQGTARGSASNLEYHTQFKVPEQLEAASTLIHGMRADLESGGNGAERWGRDQDEAAQASRETKLGELMKAASLRRTASSTRTHGELTRGNSMTRKEKDRLASMSRANSSVRMNSSAASFRRQMSNVTELIKDMPILEEDDFKSKPKTPKRRAGPVEPPKACHAVFGVGGNITSTDAFLQEAPQEEEIVKEGMLKKRIVAKDIAWKDRHITLTTDQVLIRNEVGGEIRDALDLLDITHVRTMIERNHADHFKNEDADSPSQAFRSSTRNPKTTFVASQLSRLTSGLSPNSSFKSTKSGSSGHESEVAEASEDTQETTEISESPVGGIVHTNSKSKLVQTSRKVMKLAKVAKFFSGGKTSEQDTDGSSHNISFQNSTTSIHAAEWKDVVEIYEEEYGRTYYLRAANKQEADDWVVAIQDAMGQAAAAYAASMNLSLAETLQLSVRSLMESNQMQIGVSMLLLINFIMSIVQSELGLNSSNSDTGKAALVNKLDYVEMAFTFIYTVELLLNMWAGWFWDFFSSGWSWFDLIIVVLSLVDTGFVLAGSRGKSLSVMRLLRVFRVVRIFNKLEDMKRILSANVTAFGPVLNAFLLFMVVVAIYAVIAVNIFNTNGDAPDCKGNSGCFSSFSKSFYSLLGVASGESWTTYMHNMKGKDGNVTTPVALFFVSFTILVSIVALNIIVAVLLENFVSSMNKHDATQRISEEAREHHKCAAALDPLLATLANFNSPQHFKSQLDLLFCLWDVDDNGTLDYEEMKLGLQRLGYVPQIRMNPDDWEHFSLHGLLVDENGEMNLPCFEVALRFQLADYSQRLLANKQWQSVRCESEHAPILFAMKMMMLEIMAAASERRQSALNREVDLKKMELLESNVKKQLEYASSLRLPLHNTGPRDDCLSDLNDNDNVKTESAYQKTAHEARRARAAQKEQVDDLRALTLEVRKLTSGLEEVVRVQNDMRDMIMRKPTDAQTQFDSKIQRESKTGWGVLSSREPADTMTFSQFQAVGAEGKSAEASNIDSMPDPISKRELSDIIYHEDKDIGAGKQEHLC